MRKRRKSATPVDAEIEAIKTVLSAMNPLDPETRRRVLWYVGERFKPAKASPR